MLALEPFYNTVKKTKKTPAQADEGETGPHAHGKCVKKYLMFLPQLVVMLQSE